MAGWRIGADQHEHATFHANSCDDSAWYGAAEYGAAEYPDFEECEDRKPEEDEVGTHENGDNAQDEDMGDEREVGEVLFSEEEMLKWTSKQAVLWIQQAQNPFEIFGLRPEPFSCRTSIRARYRRLSLLVHPDKNKDEGAAECFKSLSDANVILLDGQEQLKLLHKLFPFLYEMPTPDLVKSKADCKRDAKELRKAAKNAKQAAKKAAESNLWSRAPGDRIWTAEQAEAARKVELILKRKDEEAVSHIANRRFRDQLAPSKKLKRTEERLAPGLASKSWEGDGPSGGPLHVFPTPMATSTDPSGTADPNGIWWTNGLQGLTQAGWKRMESRNHPGKFYFLHSATDRTVVAAERPPLPTSDANIVNADASLPRGWEKRESTRHPGKFYYVNLDTGEAHAKKPEPTGPVRFEMHAPKKNGN